MDITQVESIDALLKDTVEKYGKIDILVNNAANVALKDGRVDELTLEMWDGIFQSDLRGTFYAVKSVLPYLKDNKGGSIINIGSMASCGGDLGSTAYACAKAGVDMLTKSTALQYGKDNIRCNCVRPDLLLPPKTKHTFRKYLKIFSLTILWLTVTVALKISQICAYTWLPMKVNTLPVKL